MVRPYDDGHEHLLDLWLRLYAREPVVAQISLITGRLDHVADRRLENFFIRKMPSCRVKIRFTLASAVRQELFD